MANTRAAASVRPTQPPPRLANTLVEHCVAAHRQQIEASQLFRCRDLTGHSRFIGTIEFSDDGELLISGGGDKTVRLWSLNQGRDGGISTVMETKHQDQVRCLALSPDNNRIFSGACDRNVFIHDTQT